jgi:hypothetical protein
MLTLTLRVTPKYPEMNEIHNSLSTTETQASESAKKPYVEPSLVELSTADTQVGAISGADSASLS